MKVVIDQLIRSKRKTLSLQIKSDGSLVVRAPMRYDISRIDRFIAEKNKWIITKQSEMKNRFILRNEILAKQELSRNDGILFLGEKTKFSFQNLSNKTEIIALYKREALKYIVPKLEYFTAKINTKYRAVKITSAQKRWGSCSARGNVNFSWRLIMAPKEIVDYVIAHETAHLLHKNHSARFWNCVETMIPDYKNCHLWLRKNGFLLDL